MRYDPSTSIFSGYSLAKVGESSTKENGSGLLPTAASPHGAEEIHHRHPVVKGCRIQLVESIPEGLVYNSTVRHMPTFDVIQLDEKQNTGAKKIKY